MHNHSLFALTAFLTLRMVFEGRNQPTLTRIAFPLAAALALMVAYGISAPLLLWTPAVLVSTLFLAADRQGTYQLARAVSPLLLATAATLLSASHTVRALIPPATPIAALWGFLVAEYDGFPAFASGRTEEVLKALLGIVLCMAEPNAFIRAIIQKFHIGHGTASDRLIRPATRTAGRLIGTLERVITFTLLLNGQYAGAGLVFTAKGIARFKELEDREFAEYFLVGSLLSFTWAGIVAGVVRG